MTADKEIDEQTIGLMLNEWRSAKAKMQRHFMLFAAVLIFVVLLLTSCAAPVVTSTPNSCSSLLPTEWSQGVAGAPLPDGDTVGDWIAFGDAQTGKLDQANGRTKDAIGIVARCEARDARAVRKATRGFFGRLFG